MKKTKMSRKTESNFKVAKPPKEKKKKQVIFEAGPNGIPNEKQMEIIMTSKVPQLKDLLRNVNTYI